MTSLPHPAPCPIPTNEPQRLQALRRYEILDTPEETAFDDIVALASSICKTPVALVSLVDAERQWFKAKVGLDARETHRDLAFCARAIMDQDNLLVVKDATEDPRFMHNPLVTDAPNIRFYAGSPLITPDGFALGTLCAIDFVPKSLSEDEKAALKVLADQVVAQLELRRQMVELERARVVAEKANHSKSLFLANMSHELRTPLAAIMGYVEFLNGNQTTETERKHWSDRALVSSRHLLSLVNDILDLSKIESGDLNLVEEPASPWEILRHVEAAMAPLAENKTLVLNVMVQSTMPSRMIVDALRIKQIMINLVGNAIKFTEHGHVNLAIEAHETDNGTCCFRVAVQDSGIGIPADEIDGIFSPFVQAHTDEEHRRSGAGLGLDISRRLVEMMGGEIDAKSCVGQGSTFSFEIHVPLAEGAVWTTRAPEVDQLYAPPNQVDSVDLSGLRVLLAEDTTDLRHIIKYRLEKMGCAVVETNNGREAMEQIQKAGPTAFDILLIDIHMPEWNGFELVEQLQVAGIHTPRIALTALAMRGDRERCLAGGFDDYLTKPVDTGLMYQKLKQYVPTQVEASTVPQTPLKPDLSTNKALATLLDTYCRNSLPEVVDQLTQAMSSQDALAAQQVVHRLSGTAGSYGFPAMGELARQIEEMIRSQVQPAPWPELHRLILHLQATISDHEAQRAST